MEEVLMNREAIGAVKGCGMFREISFHIASCRRPTDRQKIEHEFGDGIRRSWLRGLYMRRIHGGDDLIPVAVFGAKGVDETLEVEPVAEEMFQHGHAGGAAILNDDDCDAGRRHPGHEPFEMGKPLVRGNVIEGMGTEDEIARCLRVGIQNRGLDGLGLRDGVL